MLDKTRMTFDGDAASSNNAALRESATDVPRSMIDRGRRRVFAGESLFLPGIDISDKPSAAFFEDPETPMSKMLAECGLRLLLLLPEVRFRKKVDDAHSSSNLTAGSSTDS